MESKLVQIMSGEEEECLLSTDLTDEEIIKAVEEAEEDAYIPEVVEEYAGKIGKNCAIVYIERFVHV